MLPLHSVLQEGWPASVHSVLPSAFHLAKGFLDGIKAFGLVGPWDPRAELSY